MDQQLIAREFPQSEDLIYLNHAAVSPWPARTRNVVTEFASENVTLGAKNYASWMKKEGELRRQLQWLINAPFFADKPAFDNRTWGEILQFSVFFDQATGRLNTPRLSDQQGHESLRGAGFGLRFTLPGFIESKILWASEIGGNEVGNDRNQQVWGDFTYRF